MLLLFLVELALILFVTGADDVTSSSVMESLSSILLTPALTLLDILVFTDESGLLVPLTLDLGSALLLAVRGSQDPSL